MVWLCREHSMSGRNPSGSDDEQQIQQRGRKTSGDCKITRKNLSILSILFARRPRTCYLVLTFVDSIKPEQHSWLNQYDQKEFLWINSPIQLVFFFLNFKDQGIFSFVLDTYLRRVHTVCTWYVLRGWIHISENILTLLPRLLLTFTFLWQPYLKLQQRFIIPPWGHRNPLTYTKPWSAEFCNPIPDRVLKTPTLS